MLLQTNSYIVPKDKRSEHAKLVRRFRQALFRLGCDQFEVFEQVANDWGAGETPGRFVQIMKFRDRRHQLAVQEAEHSDATAQAIIKEFCDLINFPYQLQQGLFAVGFYSAVFDLPKPPSAAIDHPTPEETFVEAGAIDEADEVGAEQSQAEWSETQPLHPPDDEPLLNDGQAESPQEEAEQQQTPIEPPENSASQEAAIEEAPEPAHTDADAENRDISDEDLLAELGAADEVPHDPQAPITDEHHQ